VLDAGGAQPLGHERLGLPARVAGVEVDRARGVAGERGGRVADQVERLLLVGGRAAAEEGQGVRLDDERGRPRERAVEGVDPAAVGGRVGGASAREVAAVAPRDAVDGEEREGVLGASGGDVLADDRPGVRSRPVGQPQRVGRRGDLVDQGGVVLAAGGAQVTGERDGGAVEVEVDAPAGQGVDVRRGGRRRGGGP
jgi:hypothetical protein